MQRCDRRRVCHEYAVRTAELFEVNDTGRGDNRSSAVARLKTTMTELDETDV